MARVGVSRVNDRSDGEHAPHGRDAFDARAGSRTAARASDCTVEGACVHAAARTAAARAGEQAAANHLEAAGYQILARNLRLGRDEIDLLVLTPDQTTLVVVEVKCRIGAGARPEDRVDARKRQRLTRAAERLLQQRQFRTLALRFDVVGVACAPEGTEVTHWQGAFDAEPPSRGHWS